MVRYKDRSFQKIWLTILSLAEDKNSELYLKDGSPHRGAAHRCAFWDGFNGLRTSPQAVPGTMTMVCFQAGKEFARRSKRKA